MDLLLSFTEFDQFKEMMLFARAHLVATTPKLKSGKAAALGLKNSGQMKPVVTEKKMQASDMKHFEDCIDQLQISGVKTKVHKDECLDGEERPDLDFFVIGNSKKKK